MLALTETAADAIKTAISSAAATSERPLAGLRIMVTSGGCAGLQYGMALELQREPDDQVIETNGITILVDPDSAILLNEVTVDFVHRLEGSGFQFNNPNAARTCGCGKSYCG